MLSWFALPLLATVVYAVPLEERQSGPSVEIDDGTVVGSTSGGVDSFRGIPYAEPPTGTNRLRVPSPLAEPFGTIQATGVPTACPALLVDSSIPLAELTGDAIDLVTQSPLFQAIAPMGEDCLTVNVQRPATATADSNLPVMFWIFGGGFLLGSTSMYDGSSFVERSIDLDQPMIYVSVNYRVGGFGFLAGQDLADEGNTNLGLRDQRLALEWVQDNIAAFGGDPSRVTLWGESAGAISAFDQTIINGGDNTYNGNALFRGVIMNSGSIVPAKTVTGDKAQRIYDQVVTTAGCSGSSSLECLRNLPYNEFQNAANSVPGIFSYSSLDLSYLPRPDPGDNFFSESPELSVQRGAFTKVPVIIGDQEDEGTLFSLVQLNVTSGADIVEYFTEYFPESASQVQDLVDTYSPLISAGSPFRTGPANEIRLGSYKRLAAILGDIVFTLTRRVYLDLIADQVPAWSYLSTYFYGTPILGTFHGSDLLYAYALLGDNNVPTTSIQTYYINFVNNLDPNDGATPRPLIDWPNWSTSSPNLLNFRVLSNRIIQDDFRRGSYEYLREHVNDFAI
ncbi:hypothetical protein MBLNU230_g4744t1 [Neophaeotheca triangularis]